MNSNSLCNYNNIDVFIVAHKCFFNAPADAQTRNQKLNLEMRVRGRASGKEPFCSKEAVLVFIAIGFCRGFVYLFAGAPADARWKL